MCLICILHFQFQADLHSDKKFMSKRVLSSKKWKGLNLFDIINRNDIASFTTFLQHAQPEDLNVQDDMGNSPLHLVCLVSLSIRSLLTLQDCKKHPHKFLEDLLNSNGINVNIQNNSQNTPLHYFCAYWMGSSTWDEQ